MSAELLVCSGGVAATRCAICDLSHDGSSCITHPPLPTRCWYHHCINVIKFFSGQSRQFDQRPYIKNCFISRPY